MLLKLCEITMDKAMQMNTKIKTYSELIKLDSFIDRYNYLKLDGEVGESTFGFDRYLNQLFYKKPEWLELRDKIIARDNGCDLAMPGHEIPTKIFVHHMNPITKDDILNRSEFLLNPEYLICMSKRTHDAVHYGSEDLLLLAPKERTKYDTCPWKL